MNPAEVGQHNLESIPGGRGRAPGDIATTRTRGRGPAFARRSAGWAGRSHLVAPEMDLRTFR